RETVAAGGPPPTAVTVRPAPQDDRRTETVVSEIRLAIRDIRRFGFMGSIPANEVSRNGPRQPDISMRNPGDQEAAMPLLVSWIPYGIVGSVFVLSGHVWDGSGDHRTTVVPCSGRRSGYSGSLKARMR